MFKYYAFIAFLSLANMTIAMDTPPAPRCQFTEIEKLINGPDSPEKKDFIKKFFAAHGQSVYQNEITYDKVKNHHTEYTTPKSSPQSTRSSSPQLSRSSESN
jgi:hypothetical protein